MVPRLAHNRLCQAKTMEDLYTELSGKYSRLQRAQKTSEDAADTALRQVHKSASVRSQDTLNELVAKQEVTEAKPGPTSFLLKFKKSLTGEKLSHAELTQLVTDLDTLTNELIETMKVLKVMFPVGKKGGVNTLLLFNVSTIIGTKALSIAFEMKEKEKKDNCYQSSIIKQIDFKSFTPHLLWVQL